MIALKTKGASLDWCGSVGWAPTPPHLPHKMEGRSWILGQDPRLGWGQAPPPPLGVWEKQPTDVFLAHRCCSPSFSLPSPFSKNKIFKKIKTKGATREYGTCCFFKLFVLNPPTHDSFYLPVCLSVYLSIYLSSIYLPTVHDLRPQHLTYVDGKNEKVRCYKMVYYKHLSSTSISPSPQFLSAESKMTNPLSVVRLNVFWDMYSCIFFWMVAQYYINCIHENVFSPLSDGHLLRLLSFGFLLLLYNGAMVSGAGNGLTCL